MQYQNPASIKSLSSRSDISKSGLLLMANLIFPFVIHTIPFTGAVPLGAYILPIFYAPLLAVYLTRNHYWAYLTVLAPFLNFMLFGKPEYSVALILTLELIVFLSICRFFIKDEALSMINGGLSYFATKVFSSYIFIGVFGILPVESSQFFFQSVTNGLPGIGVLIVISYLLSKSSKY